MTTLAVVFDPANTRYVFQSMIKNIIKKKMRNPYLKYFDFIHPGVSFFLESPNLPPSRPNSCPLPQYLLQYALLPYPVEIISGIKKQKSPSQANRILKNPNIRYVRETTHR